MKYRPIIMGAESIQAILEDPSRKVMTRRVIKKAYAAEFEQVGEAVADHVSDAGDGRWVAWWSLLTPEELDRMSRSERMPEGFGCPQGQPGDRLWVREVWSPVERESDAVAGVKFKADGSFVPIKNTRKAADAWIDAANNDHSGRWRTPLYIPRWASRITLEVTDVRVERVQDISEDDAQAEGIRPVSITVDCGAPTANTAACGGGYLSAREMFGAAWDSLNAKRGFPWANNPWVWVISFRRIKP